MNGARAESTPLRKVVLVGSGAVGKTTLASRLITGTYIQQTMTVGLNVETWTVEDSAEQAAIKIISFDLGGQNQFRFFQQEMIRGANFAMIVFDLTRYESFMDLEEWMGFIGDIPEKCRVLVANKADMESVVSDEEIRTFAEKHSLPVVRTSCVTGQGIEELERVIWESLKGNGICG